jgi:uncharacterized peroxidase-related enzyme
MAFFRFLDESSGIAAVFANNKVRARPMRKLLRQIMRGPSPLSVGERELIAAFVSTLNRCEFCAGGHTAFAARTVNVAVIDELIANVDTAAIADRLKPIFRFAKKLTEAPSCIVQADVDSILATGWEETAAEDAIAVCSLFNMLNRIADGYGLRSSGGWWQSASVASF